MYLYDRAIKYDSCSSDIHMTDDMNIMSRYLFFFLLSSSIEFTIGFIRRLNADVDAKFIRGKRISSIFLRLDNIRFTACSDKIKIGLARE